MTNEQSSKSIWPPRRPMDQWQVYCSRNGGEERCEALLPRTPESMPERQRWEVQRQRWEMSARGLFKIKPSPCYARFSDADLLELWERKEEGDL